MPLNRHANAVRVVKGKEVKVIIPVAGKGTRLLPHTEKRQKCLLPVAGKPVLDHIVEPLLAQGFDDIVLVTGHMEDQVKRYVEKFGGSFAFLRQRKPLGLGHAVFQGLEDSRESALIQLGDVIYDLDFETFCDSPNHVIAVDEVPDPERFGVVEVKDRQIVAVYEKPASPPTNLAVVGLYYVASQKPLWQAIRYLIKHNITTKGEIQLADAFQRMIEVGETIIQRSVSRWFDCGIPETFLSTNRALLTQSGHQIEGSTIIEPVSIGESCRIENSTIGPYVTVMDRVQIIDSHVSDSIVLWNAKIKSQTIHGEIVSEG